MAPPSADGDGPRSRPSTPGFTAARPGSRCGQARPLSAPSPGSSSSQLPTPRGSACTPSGRGTPRGGFRHAISSSTLPFQPQQQTGHSAATPVFNISPAPPAAAAAPAAAAPPAPSTGKWKAAAGASGGPVFQLVSRGARLPAASPILPAPPIKTHSTAPRTKARIGAGDASSGRSPASVSLRRNLGAPGGAAQASSPALQPPPSASPSPAASSASLRSSSSGSSLTSSSSSRIGLGVSSRLAASSSSTGGGTSSTSAAAGRSSARTAVAAAAACMPVARMLTFEDATDDAAAAPGAAAAGGDVSAARDQQAVPALPLGEARLEARLEADVYGSSAGDDFLAQHLQGFDSSGSNCTTWLLSDAACADGRQGARPGASLPAGDTDGGGGGSHAAARMLWEQLLSKLGGLAAEAAGVPLAALRAALAANNGSGEAGRTGAGNALTEQLLGAAAGRLQAGAPPEREAAQLLLPVLLLQLAGAAAVAAPGGNERAPRPSAGGQDGAGSCSGTTKRVHEAVRLAVSAAAPQLLLALSGGGGGALSATKHQAATSTSAASSKAWLAAALRVGALMLGGLLLLAAGLMAGVAVCALESEEPHDGLGGYSGGLAGLHSRLAA